MATTAGDIYVRSGTSGAFTSVQYVQGGWITVASSSNMTNLDNSRLKDGQVIYVENSDQLYITRKFVAFETPGYGGTDDSSSFHTTNLGISGGGGGSFNATPLNNFTGSAQTSINALNTFSGSAQTSISAINAATASFLQTLSFNSGTSILTLSNGNTADLSSLSGGGGSGIFATTGSVKSTTNNIEVTGSVMVNGMFKLKKHTTTPTAVEGAIFYSASNLYFGTE